MSDLPGPRRQFLITAGAGLLLSSAGVGPLGAAENRGESKKAEEKEIGAVEDLMREHGVIRRTLLA
jgi:hypothetical protein